MNNMCKQYENTIVHFPELAPSKELFYEIKNHLISKDEYNCRYIEEQKNHIRIETISILLQI
jgi:hypothetical protein